MAISAVLERTTRLRTEEDEQLARVAEEHNRRSLESYRALVSESRPEAPEREAAAKPVSSYAQAAADYRAVEMPTGTDVLFGDIEYRNGELVHAGTGTEVAAPAPEIESEDARPTARTLETLNRDMSELTIPAEAQVHSEERVSFLSALSTRTKVVLAVVAVAIVVALVLVFVNTAILGGLDVTLAARQAESARLAAIEQSLRDQISQVTSPEYVDAWAKNIMGMVRQ